MKFKPEIAPKDARYYFNILVIAAAEVGRDVDTWYLEHITDPIPYAVHVFGDDREYIEAFPQAVLEVDPSLGISWYRG